MDAFRTRQKPGRTRTKCQAHPNINAVDGSNPPRCKNCMAAAAFGKNFGHDNNKPK